MKKESFLNPALWQFIVVSAISLFSHSASAQISGEVVYKCLWAENPRFQRDTLRFDGNYLLNIHKRVSDQWKTKEQIQITIAPTNSTWYFDMKTRQSVIKKYNFTSGRFQYEVDTLKPYAWKILNEFKTIGKYRAQKAVVSVNTDYGLHEVTAWFTPDIRVQGGIDQMWGLPGLIVEYLPIKLCTCTMETIVMKPVGDIKFSDNVVLKNAKSKVSKQALNELLNKGSK